MAELGKTPPLGWNSWNTFSWNIDENLVKGAADALISTGLRDAGYEYIVVDDCWSLKERGANGELVADPAKFPSGMKALADCIHGKGLKFGMYSCTGTHTCAGYPGSFEREFQDAAQFAAWEIDLLKYDYCFKPEGAPGHILYRRMSAALKNCGRDILLAACNWGNDDVFDWIRGTGAHSFRSTTDIQDNWDSIKALTRVQFDKLAYGGAFCYNDMDMLVVGMGGKSDNEWIAAGGCNEAEYRTHFAIWAILSSPLMIGCDIRNMDEQTRNLLTNREILAINQDIEGRGAYKIAHNTWNGADNFTLVKPLANGDYAVCLVNFGEKAVDCAFTFWDLGLSIAQRRGLQMFDCWAGADIGVHTERFCVKIEPHDCKIYRAKVVTV